MSVSRYFLFFFLYFNAFTVNGLNDTLKVAYTRAAPFIITHNDQPEGISIWLWDKIASDLEIEYELVEMNFGNILKGLEDGTVDLSINPLTVTSERSKKITPYDGLTEGLDGLVNGEVAAFLYDEPILKYRLINEPAYEPLTTLPIKFDLQFYAFAFSNQHDHLNKSVSQKILEYTEGMDWRLLLAEYDLAEL